MGKMKWISQMIEDGSFEGDFMPLYIEAKDNNKPIFTYAGTTYSTSYARIIVDFVKGTKDKLEIVKRLEK